LVQQRVDLMTEVTIEATPNGPYLVTGLIELRDANGKVLPTKSKVCRCGASTKKPFCDGTHSKIGFQAAAKAVPGMAPSWSARDPTEPADAGDILMLGDRGGPRWNPAADPTFCFTPQWEETKHDRHFRDDTEPSRTNSGC
jgi:CDGSH-type Zn-finger protein